MPEQVLLEIGLALAIVAFAGILAARFRVSIVPLLILAGMVVGPHAPVIGILDFRFIKSAPLIDFMGRVGILFLLFSLGLEFSVGRLLKAGRSILVGGSIYMAINFTLGMVLPIIWGWPLRETLVVAGLISISSSAIVAKVLVDLKRTARPETEMILGLMLFQDVFVAVYLSIISGLVLTGSASPASVLKSTSLALGFMLGLILAGRKLAPLINRLLNVPSDEVFMLIVFAFLTLVAGFSETIHVAEAIGALLVGLILAETDHLDRIEHIVVPFRDFFGALFFFQLRFEHRPFNLGRGRRAGFDCRSGNINRQFSCWYSCRTNGRLFVPGVYQYRAYYYSPRRIFYHPRQSGEDRRITAGATTLRSPVCVAYGYSGSFTYERI